MDEVSLLSKDSEALGFVINGKEFYADEEGHVEVQVDELKGFKIKSIPPGFFLWPLEGNTIIFDGEMASSDDHAGVAMMNIQIYRKYWDHKFGAAQYLDAMKTAIELREKSERDVQFNDVEDDDAFISIRYNIFLTEDLMIDEAFQRFRQIVKEIEGYTERILEKEEISPELLDDETKFSLEILLPLIRAMGFYDIKYNHGKREFGKDITFSEFDRFGIRRNFGVQVKKGDLSGEAGSELDKLIGQIDDAFTLPYIETTSREERYISDLIISISGRFTDNAQIKIVEKVKHRNIYFMDIDKIQELLTKYMGKKIQ